jgi:hypothetical protein
LEANINARCTKEVVLKARYLAKEKREKEDLNKARSGDTSTEYERVKIPAP